MTITATDVTGAEGSASVSFMLDRPPELSIGDNDLATPKLRLAITCEDDDAAKGCVSLEVAPLGLKGTGGVIDETVSLRQYEGKSVDLEVKATDSRGQTTTLKRTVFVESSPKLEVAFTSAHGVVRDTDGARVLVVSDDASSIVVESIDGGSQDIYNGPAGSVKEARLAESGVVFATEVGETKQVVYSDGADLTVHANTNDFQVRGKWLAVRQIKSSEPRIEDLVLIDLALGTEVFHVAPEAPADAFTPSLYALADDGDLVWVGDDGQLYRLSGGVVSPEDLPPTDTAGLATDGATGLSTDGENIALLYAKGTKLDLLTGEGVVSLCVGQEATPCRLPLHQSDLTVFERPVMLGDGARYQVFRRTADGQQSKVSLFLADTFASALSPSGQVMMESGGRRYLSHEDEAPTDVSSLQGTVIWAGDWYVMLGRSLLRVNPDGVAMVDPDDADAGMPDAGPVVVSDAGADDAGIDGADAGAEPNQPRNPHVPGGKGPGTTCSVSLKGHPAAFSVPGLWLLLLASWALAKRRARKAARREAAE